MIHDVPCEVESGVALEVGDSGDRFHDVIPIISFELVIDLPEIMPES